MKFPINSSGIVPLFALVTLLTACSPQSDSKADSDSSQEAEVSGMENEIVSETIQSGSEENSSVPNKPGKTSSGPEKVPQALATKSPPIDSDISAGGYALLIGIDKYSKSPLSSCVADVHAMKKLLVDVYDFPEKNIRTLTDEAADKEGIFNAIQNWLTPRVSTTDQVVFFFSGHGTQVHDYNGDEEDGLDEALCPVNIFDTTPVQANQYITDDELGNLLGQIRAKAAKLTAIIDSCHSGTGTRSILGEDEIRRLPTKFMDIGYVEPPALTKSANGITRQRNAIDGITTLFACQPDQKAVAGHPGELSVFTRNVITALSSRPNYSSQELLANIAPQVIESSGYYQQRPGVDGDTNGPAIVPPGTKITVTPGGFQTPPEPSPEVARQNVSGNQNSVLYGELIRHSDFSVWVDTDKSAYCKDDLMRLTVRSAENCFIRIYLINAASETVQIFPNAFQSENFIRAGDTVTVPPANGAFRFRMTEPFGVETIKVVASTSQFSDLKNLEFQQGEVFRAYEGLNPSATGTKGISVEAVPPAQQAPGTTPSPTKPKIAEAAIRYVVSDCGR